MGKKKLKSQLEALLVEDVTDNVKAESASLEPARSTEPELNAAERGEVEAEVAKERLSPAAIVELSEAKTGPATPDEEIDWWTGESAPETASSPNGHSTLAGGVKTQDSPLRVLIVHTDLEVALIMAKFFTTQGNPFWHATDTIEARLLLKQHQPEVVVLDLHLPDESGPDFLHYLRQQFPHIKVLFTTHSLDSEQEAFAQAQGAQLLLRQSFTQTELEQAWSQLIENIPFSQPVVFEDELPRVRLPMRLKITLPYVLLAMLIALVGTYIVNRVVLESIEERFSSRLIEVGQLTADWMVQEENRLLETLRLLSYTQGLSDAVVAQDAERLRELVLPIVINYHEEAIEILDNRGQSMLSLHHRRNGRVEDYTFSQGDNVFTQWEFVQPVLAQQVDEQGDKYAGLAQAPWGDYFYVAGPILDEEGRQVGVMLLGKSLATMIGQIQQDTLAHATIYDLNGRPLASTLSFVKDDNASLIPRQNLAVLEQQPESSTLRDLMVGSVDYTEILGPWQARGDETLGLMGASLAQTFLLNTSQLTRFHIFGLVATTFLLVIVVGVLLSNQITNPLLQMMRASAEVAQGNLDVSVEPVGNDEIAVLSHSFNRMVSRLREGALYRDLLGRTVSPEVREELRQTFAAGTLHLEGHNALATVLITDIRDFTPLSEKVTPPTILSWLNEYFGELVPIITSYGGVVNGFQGDALLAFFGILPRSLTPQESAQRACLTAVDMLKAIEAINLRRAERGEPVLITGIGINTGIVIAGGLGSVDRLHYTILGDTVNTTKRLESLTRQFGGSGVIISEHTLLALGEWQQSFHTEPLGPHLVKGKSEQVQVYRLWPTEKGMGVRKTSDEQTDQF